MTGKGLWAELEFMEEAECKEMLKGEHILFNIVHFFFTLQMVGDGCQLSELETNIQALPGSGPSTDSFSPPLSSVLPRFPLFHLFVKFI